MIERETFKQIINYILIIILFILAFFIIRPIFFAVAYGLILAYLTHPLYRWIRKKIKNETLSAFIVCFFVLTILLAFLLIVVIYLLKQSVNLFLSLQKIDVGEIIVRSLPKSIIDQQVSVTIASNINGSLPTLLARLSTIMRDFILNLPELFLQLLVLAFVYFFALKDGEKAFEYFKSLSPLKKETQKKFFDQFENITKSVIIGEFAVGIIQGIVAGIGFFIFGVPNALLLTVLTAIFSILPIIGPWIIWVPVDVYLFVSGNDTAGFGLLIYGLVLISWVDNIVRPMIISRMTQINHAIVLIGMIGGLYIFGLAGLIIGPLILAYVLLVFELYRKQTLGEDSIIFKKVET